MVMLVANYFGRTMFGTRDTSEIELHLIKVRLRVGTPARYLALLLGVT